MKNIPDKIYIQPNAHDRWFEGNKPNDNFVEYVYKDAFIKKVCDYFAPHISDNSGGYDRARIIEDFKKYIKD